MRKLGLFLLLVGCTRANPLSIDGDGGSSACSAHTDQASCAADSSCIPLGCPGCNGTTSFIGCFDKNQPLPGVSCPSGICATCHGLDEKSCAAAASRGCIVASCCGAYQGCLDPGEGFGCNCASCQGLDEATCKTRPDCRADYCPTCNGQFFTGCDDATAPPVACAPPPCPMMPCDQVTTQTGCDARSDCHSIFQAGACGCANCCCTFFARCEAGQFADCKGPAFCNSAPPDCANPACKGMFTVAYANQCYDGCVLQTACAP